MRLKHWTIEALGVAAGTRTWTLMGERPTGTVTFLFTDIEGSTALWEADAPAMERAVELHDSMLRAEFEARGG